MSKKKRGKANQLVKKKRLQKIMDLMGQGMMRFEILDECMNEWDMSERGVQEYINAANKLIKESFTDEDIIAGYSKIFKNTLQDNPNVARQAYDSIVKLKKGNIGSQAGDIIITIKREDNGEDNN